MLRCARVEQRDVEGAKAWYGIGKVIREPFDIPNVERIAIVEDATGAVIGFMTGADGATASRKTWERKQGA